jgi:hypothetical protein
MATDVYAKIWLTRLKYISMHEIKLSIGTIQKIQEEL